MRSRAFCQFVTAALLALGLLTTSCASIKQYETRVQPLDTVLHTHTGGVILRIEKEESLPNALGGADIYGGRRPRGFTELKYLGLSPGGTLQLRVFSTDIATNENWRRRFGREGTATSSSDAVDFEHDAKEPFDMAGTRIVFLEATASGTTYRLGLSPRTEQPSG